jgi:hypothetical protein
MLVALQCLPEAAALYVVPFNLSKDMDYATAQPVTSARHAAVFALWHALPLLSCRHVSCSVCNAMQCDTIIV